MDALVIVSGILAVLLLFFLVVLKPTKKRIAPATLPGNYRQLLFDNVAFYRKLDEEGKRNFESRVQQFLSSVRITGIGTPVENIDRVLIGASAIIPIYAFPSWEYVNIREVLLYPETFNEQFEIQCQNRSVLGMVCDG